MKHLYVETDSLELKESCETGWLRVIIGDANDVDVRAAQYKGKRRQDFFAMFTIPNRDHQVHAELKRVKNTSTVRYIAPTDDVQSVEVFEFKIESGSSDEEKKLTVSAAIAEVIRGIGGEVETFSFVPTSWQRRAIEFVGECWQQQKKTLVLELAARFGKTGTLLTLLEYSDANVMVVANYFKSVNTSFAAAIRTSFSDRFRWVDVSAEDFELQLDSALAEGYKVVVGCALHNKARLANRMQKLASIPNRIVVVDEADFGTHTKAQFEKVDALRYEAPLILMTGTNADRAMSKHEIDASLSVTYFDMLMMAADTLGENQ